MILLEESQDWDTIESIFKHPILYHIIYGTEADPKSFILDKSYKYLLIKNDTTLIGCFKIKAISRVCIEGHMGFLPEIHGTPLIEESFQVVHKLLKEQGYLKVLCLTPANCIQVIKLLNKLHYKPCGMITKGAIYNNYLVTLLMYDFEV